jgi:hypothetical protein
VRQAREEGARGGAFQGGGVTDPFKIDGPTCISFSGGRTSAYMLWRVLQSNGGLPDDAVVCFANTGKEDEGTLRFVRDCGLNWGVDISWIEYRDGGFARVDFDSASGDGKPYEDLIAKRKYLPNPVTRFCTSDLKIKPITSYLKARGWDDFDMMLGIRADEPRRAAKMPHHLLPLVRANVTKKDVLKFWRQQPFDLVAEAGNCDLCFLKGMHELMPLIRQKPERAVWWAKQEEKIGATFRSDRPTYAQMKANAENQQEMFDDEAVDCFCGD